MVCLCGYVYASGSLFGLVWRCRMAPSSGIARQLANHDGYGRALRTGRFTPNGGGRPLRRHAPSGVPLLARPQASNLRRGARVRKWHIRDPSKRRRHVPLASANYFHGMGSSAREGPPRIRFAHAGCCLKLTPFLSQPVAPLREWALKSKPYTPGEPPQDARGTRARTRAVLLDGFNGLARILKGNSIVRRSEIGTLNRKRLPRLHGLEQIVRNGLGARGQRQG
jgi:hypothetical protein